MKERLNKLLTVKSIVTIALTALFVGVAAAGEIPQEVMTIYTTVIAFYFGTQATKE
jgi:hypothetical protein